MQRLQDSAEERSSHGRSDMVEVVLGWWEGSHGVHGTGSPAQSQTEHLCAASKSGIAHVASKGTAQTRLPALNDWSGARFSPGNSFLSQAYSRLLCEMLPVGGNDLSFEEEAELTLLFHGLLGHTACSCIAPWAWGPLGSVCSLQCSADTALHAPRTLSAKGMLVLLPCSSLMPVSASAFWIAGALASTGVLAMNTISVSQAKICMCHVGWIALPCWTSTCIPLRVPLSLKWWCRALVLQSTKNR